MLSFFVRKFHKEEDVEKQTSITANGLLWFGAAISIAEMLSGTFFASLGWQKGLLAIVIGHLLGGALMLGAGLIGGKLRQNAMTTVARSFGSKGGQFFAGLNVLQLIGWTAVMILSGAQACQLFLPLSTAFWVIVIGGLTAIWVLVGLGNLTKLNSLAMASLLAAVLYLSFLLTKGSTASVPSGELTFGGAVELAIAMPLSWLPLISDYTSVAQKPIKSTWASVIIYNLTSSWMYFVGMMGVLVTGQEEIAAMMKSFGLGVVALIIIVLSTVTTTFLDVYSAGISSQTIWSQTKAKTAGLLVCVVGMAIALFVPMAFYENFLYLISSVFVPMITIQIVDFFWFRKKAQGNWQVGNFILWTLGFIIYQVFLQMATPFGSTVPVVLIVAGSALIHHILRRKKDVKRLS